MDSPIGIINTMLAKVLVGSETPEVRIKKLKEVTITNIIELNKKIKINSAFLLKGDSDGNKD